MSLPKHITFASHNLGKLKELQKYFQADNIMQDTQLHPIAEFTDAKAKESGNSFIENALIKVNHALEYSPYPAFSDDSGLVVPALKGAPGVHSSRYANEHATDKQNIKHLIQQIKQASLKFPQPAFFYCVMVYKSHKKDPIPLIAQGTFYGNIIEQEKGKQGFGYDPVFLVTQYNKTAAQLSLEIKNTLSHRAYAIKQLVQNIRGQDV